MEEGVRTPLRSWVPEVMGTWVHEKGTARTQAQFWTQKPPQSQPSSQLQSGSLSEVSASVYTPEVLGSGGGATLPLGREPQLRGDNENTSITSKMLSSPWAVVGQGRGEDRGLRERCGRATAASLPSRWCRAHRSL